MDTDRSYFKFLLHLFLDVYLEQWFPLSQLLAPLTHQNDKELVSLICKELLQIKEKKAHPQQGEEHWGKGHDGQFAKKESQQTHETTQPYWESKKVSLR